MVKFSNSSVKDLVKKAIEMHRIFDIFLHIVLFNEEEKKQV